MTTVFRKIICSLLLAILATLSSQAQLLNDIQNSFKSHSQAAPQEKVFIHSDKGAYLTGEILWFKVYVVDGSYHKPFDLSKVAYVEVLDDALNPVMQAKIELRNGAGSGSLYIPVTLNNGNYHLWACTNWMKNFSPDFYFDKKLAIVNP